MEAKLSIFVSTRIDHKGCSRGAEKLKLMWVDNIGDVANGNMS